MSHIFQAIMWAALLAIFLAAMAVRAICYAAQKDNTMTKLFQDPDSKKRRYIVTMPVSGMIRLVKRLKAYRREQRERKRIRRELTKFFGDIDRR